MAHSCHDWLFHDVVACNVLSDPVHDMVAHIFHGVPLCDVVAHSVPDVLPHIVVAHICHCVPLHDMEAHKVDEGRVPQPPPACHGKAQQWPEESVEPVRCYMLTSACRMSGERGEALLTPLQSRKLLASHSACRNS